MEEGKPVIYKIFIIYYIMASESQFGFILIFTGLCLFILFFILRYFLNISLYYLFSGVLNSIKTTSNEKNYTFDEECYNDDDCYNTNLLIYSLIFFFNFLLICCGLAFATNRDILISNIK